MSLFRPVNLICPACQGALNMQAVGSVNADRRPDFREDILQDRFQDITCPACGERFRLQPEFNYLHVKMGQWIAALPALRLPDHLAAAAEVAEVFATSYGAKAPPAAREIGAELTVRLTFGWPAVREKILARAAGLDDAVLELLKLEMLRNMTTAPLQTGVELRLVQDLGADLAFAWLDAASEGSAGQSFLLARHAYDALAAEAARPEGRYAALRAELLDGPFVDLQKLFLGQGRAAPPARGPEPAAAPAAGG